MYLLARCWCCGAEWNYYSEFWWNKVGEVGFHRGNEGCPCCYSNLIILPMRRQNEKNGMDETENTGSL